MSGEPDARKRACPVREGAVGFPCYQGAGRLPHRKIVVAASIALDTSPSMEGMRVDDGASAEATSQHTWCLTTARSTTGCVAGRPRMIPSSFLRAIHIMVLPGDSFSAYHSCLGEGGTMGMAVSRPPPLASPSRTDCGRVNP